MKRLLMIGCVLLLGQGPALAQEEAVEELPADEAPVEELPAEDASPEEAAVEEIPPEEAAVEEVAAEPVEEEEPAWEGQGSGHVDVYYVATADSALAGAHERGDGVGGRAQYQFWKFLAVSGEYTARKLGDLDAELTDQRFGLGAVAHNSAGDTGGLFVEYERLEFDDGSVTDGFGLHGRMSHPVYDWLRFYADIGYKQLDGEAEEFSGFEFNAGLAATFGPAGLFVDWRRGQLEGKDSAARPSLEDVRVGARWAFGS
jgi:hypothetical protein